MLFPCPVVLLSHGASPVATRSVFHSPQPNTYSVALVVGTSEVTDYLPLELL